MKPGPGFDGLLEEMRLPLETGDIVVFYTDGVTEAMNRKSEPFGYGRLEGTLAASAHLSAEEIKKEVLAKLERFRDGEELSDDVTLVVAKII
jgi:sigma-B regulation protein RsbU (phosphoserine phosphatase)